MVSEAIACFRQALLTYKRTHKMSDADLAALLDSDRNTVRVFLVGGSITLSTLEKWDRAVENFFLDGDVFSSHAYAEAYRDFICQRVTPLHTFTSHGRLPSLIYQAYVDGWDHLDVRQATTEKREKKEKKEKQEGARKEPS